MIKNKGPMLSFSASLIIAIIFHLVVLLFVKKNNLDLKMPDFNILNANQLHKINQIKLITPEELEKIKRVGIKNGVKKNYFQPDMLKIPKPTPAHHPSLSLGSLAPVMPPLPVEEIKKPTPPKKAASIQKTKKQDLPIAVTKPIKNENGHIYYNPKKEKQISSNHEQDNLKQEAYNKLPANSNNPVAQKMSNFEIRYERPEGVSEDELNSDEKAYYAFFKRSYSNYLSKLYATYEKISVERPGLERDFNNTHLLIGRIDYDEKGNIVMVKILKSSESDDMHYFFEETLKQLNLPNPPKSFVKNKKQFSTYYQIQIN